MATLKKYAPAGAVRALGLTALCAAALLALGACSESKDDPTPSTGDTAQVTLRTNVLMNTRTEATPITEIADGQKMNVYVKAYNSIDAADLISNASATNAGGVWTVSPDLRLDKQQTAFIYAFYPYAEGNTDPKAVPVNVADQKDYLYSGAYVAATYNSNVATLNMKHAQAMVSLNIKGDNYHGQGLVTKIEVGGSELVATHGTINVSTGKFTPTATGNVAVAVSATVGADGISGQLPSLWVMPFTTTGVTNAVSLKVTIDGREYATYMPELTMRTGWQYIVQAVLTDKGLVVLPEATQEYQLDNNDAPMPALQGYGLLTFGVSGSTFAYPAFAGENVFGNVNVGSAAGTNYTLGGSATLNGATSVTIETWNSTGFTVDSFEGIDRIDISAY